MYDLFSWTIIFISYEPAIEGECWYISSTHIVPSLRFLLLRRVLFFLRVSVT